MWTPMVGSLLMITIYDLYFSCHTSVYIHITLQQSLAGPIKGTVPCHIYVSKTG